MARHTSPKKKRIEDAYPIRVKFKVPPNGLGNRISDINVWIRDCGESIEQTSTRAIFVQAFAIYFRTPEMMLKFLRDFPDLELADGVSLAKLD